MSQAILSQDDFIITTCGSVVSMSFPTFCLNTRRAQRKPECFIVVAGRRD